MFDTVIVPLDGSPHAEFAIPFAIDEARRHGATLLLIHVIPRPEPCTVTNRRSGPLPWQGEWPFEDLDTARRDARAYLQNVVTRFALDPKSAVRVEVGDPAVRVAAAARGQPGPLVVMLTGDCTREACPPLSLVASYLMIAGAVPVLGIRQPAPAACLTRTDAIELQEPHPRFTRPGPAVAPGSLPTASSA